MRRLRTRSWAFRPAVETCEGRLLLSAAAHRPHHPVSTAHYAPPPVTLADRLAPYRVFEAFVQRGPNAGQTYSGRLVLGITDGRGQVIGEFFQQGQRPATVVGLVFGGEVSLLFYLPDGNRIQASGAGQLRRVNGGLPDGMTLVGSGILQGPGLHNSGHWLTVRA